MPPITIVSERLAAFEDAYFCVNHFIFLKAGD